MADSISNRPNVLKGAFVEYIKYKPKKTKKKEELQVIPFQFNPEQLTRSRNIGYDAPGEWKKRGRKKRDQQFGLRQFHQYKKDLKKIHEERIVQIEEESIDLEIRLDASELGITDVNRAKLGILPELHKLEHLLYPLFPEVKLKRALRRIKRGRKIKLLKERLPIVLFIWGKERVLPVYITSLKTTEILFNRELNPIRATVSVGLTVIERLDPNEEYLPKKNEKFQKKLKGLHIIKLPE